MKPVRIVHVVGGMERAGIETWLMHVLRRIDRTRFRFDFLVHTANPCAYDEEIRDLGSRIIPCPYPRRPWRYIPELRTALQQYGPYDVVHSHVHRFSGLVLRIARRVGIPQRIAHSHISSTDQNPGFFRRIYLRRLDQWINREATVGLAASREAATDLFGAHWGDDVRWRVLPCGIDLDPFAAISRRQEVRTELGLSPEDLVIGHVGRFVAVKNHLFLLEVAALMQQLRPGTRLLLVGEGELRSDIEAQARKIGLSVIYTGSRGDVPRLLTAMDVFVFPSLHEGLGLAVVEAQAAGVPVLTSTGIPSEAILVPGAILRIPLLAGAQAWADAALAFQRPEHQRSLAQVAASRFNLAANIDDLLALYERAAA